MSIIAIPSKGTLVVIARQGDEQITLYTGDVAAVDTDRALVQVTLYHGDRAGGSIKMWIKQVDRHAQVSRISSSYKEWRLATDDEVTAPLAETEVKCVCG